jgi:hypothetical protein
VNSIRRIAAQRHVRDRPEQPRPRAEPCDARRGVGQAPTVEAVRVGDVVGVALAGTRTSTKHTCAVSEMSPPGATAAHASLSLARECTSTRRGVPAWT